MPNDKIMIRRYVDRTQGKIDPVRYTKHREVYVEESAAIERERCKFIVRGFAKLSKWWKIAICAAIDNPDWPVTTTCTKERDNAE